MQLSMKILLMLMLILNSPRPISVIIVLVPTESRKFLIHTIGVLPVGIQILE